MPCVYDARRSVDGLARHDEAELRAAQEVDGELTTRLGGLLGLDPTCASALRLALHWRDERGDLGKAETLLRTTLLQRDESGEIRSVRPFICL